MGNSLEVDTHEFPGKELGKAIPYGVYDIHHNEAWGFRWDQSRHG